MYEFHEFNTFHHIKFTDSVYNVVWRFEKLEFFFAFVES